MSSDPRWGDDAREHSRENVQRDRESRERDRDSNDPRDAFMRHVEGTRWRLLYRRWLADGDAVFDIATSPKIRDAFARGDGMIESEVLPRTVEAVIDEQGNVRLLEPVRPGQAQRALVTILDERPNAQASELAVLSEVALAQDWNRSDEDAPWSHLQRVR